MSQLLYAHNVSQDEFDDQDYEALYSSRRRDSNFAAADLRHRAQAAARAVRRRNAPALA